MLCKRAQVVLCAMGMLIFFHDGVLAQQPIKLCENAMKPSVSRFVLHWDQFNQFGNVRVAFRERDFAQVGEGASCKISSLREPGKTSTRPCHWTPRVSCELELGQAPVQHSFGGGAVRQSGTLQWTGTQSQTVLVKRGEMIEQEQRETAVVRFVGRWIRGMDSGESMSTAYFDREWGVLLKLEGANDANIFIDNVTLVEMLP